MGMTNTNTNAGSVVESFLRAEEEAHMRQKWYKLWVNCSCHHGTLHLGYSFSLPSLDTQSDQA